MCIYMIRVYRGPYIWASIGEVIHMKSLIDWVRIMLAIAMLVGICIVVWQYKWALLGSVLVFVLAVMATNALYHRRTGRDIALYTRIFKD
jgi:hypothetical protein